MGWYVAKGGGSGQALVVDEADGRSVAVAYDGKDAPLLAAAPELLAALRGMLDLRPDREVYRRAEAAVGEAGGDRA